jgi:AraC-like DNA-binding protein
MDIAGEKQDKFPVEKVVQVPLRVLNEAKEKAPALFRIYITKIGYIPSSAKHHRSIYQGSRNNILLYCIRGSGQCVIGSKRFTISANEYLLIPATRKMVCFWPDHNDPWTIYYVYYTGPEITAFNKALNITLTKGPVPITYNEAGISIWHKIFSSLSDGFKRENLNNANFSLQHLISTFLYPSWHIRDNARKDQGAMDRAVEIMKEKVNTKISVTEIANIVDLSYSHFCMLFKKRFDTSPIDYFIGLKIEKACELLGIDGCKIKDVSSELGYDDPYYFSRIFKKVVGISPEKFRSKQNQNN